MKKLLAFAALFAVVALTSCKYDDDDLWNSVHGLENRVAKLEELCKQMNTNIASLQTIVTALQNNVYVTGLHLLCKTVKKSVIQLLSAKVILLPFITARTDKTVKTVKTGQHPPSA